MLVTLVLQGLRVLGIWLRVEDVTSVRVGVAFFGVIVDDVLVGVAYNIGMILTGF